MEQMKMHRIIGHGLRIILFVCRQIEDYAWFNRWRLGMTLGWRNPVTYLFLLHITGVFISTASMEATSWLLFLSATVLFTREKIAGRLQWKDLLISPRRIWIDIALGLFLLQLILSGLFQAQGDVQFLDISGVGRWVLLLYAYVFLFRRYYSVGLEKGFRWMMFVAALVSLYGIFQYFSGNDLVRETDKQLIAMDEYYRAIGFFNLPLTFAYSIGIFGFFVLAYRLVAANKLWKWGNTMSSVVALLIGAVILATFVRGAWLGVMGAGIVVLWLNGRRFFMRAAAVSAVVLAVLLIAMPTFRDRVITITDIGESSNAGRIKIWTANFAMFANHPIVGVGLGQNNRMIGDYYERLGIENGQIGHAHSNYLQISVGMGIVGFTLFVTFSLFFLWLAWHLWRNLPKDAVMGRWIALGSLGAQVYLHIGGFTECNFNDVEVTHMILLTWALTVATVTHYQQEQKLDYII